MENPYITEETVNNNVNKLINLIESAKEQLSSMQQENAILNSTRSLSLIHLAQYKQDYDILNTTIRRFKDMLDNDQITQNSEFLSSQLSSASVPAFSSSMNSIIPISPSLMQTPSQVMQLPSNILPLQSQVVQIQPSMISIPSNVMNMPSQLIQIPSSGPIQPFNVVPQAPPGQIIGRDCPIMASSTNAKIIEQENTEFEVKQEKRAPTENIKKEVPQEVEEYSEADESSEQTYESDSYVQPQENVPVKTELGFEVNSDEPLYKDGNHIRLLHSFNINDVICTVDISCDGSMYAFASSTNAFIIDAEDGSIINKINILYNQSIAQFNTRCLRFTPDGTKIALNNNTDVFIFDIKTGKHINTLSGHTKMVSSILFTNSGKTLITTGHDNVICMWNMDKYELIKKVDLPDTVKSGDIIVSAAIDFEQSFVTIALLHGGVGVFDTEFSQPMHYFKAQKSKMLSIDISPFDGSIATGSYDSYINIYGFHGELNHRTKLSGHTNKIVTLEFKPDGHILFSGSRDETIRAWDYKKGNTLFEIVQKRNTIFEISHHPTLNRFVSCSGQGSVCLWEYDVQ